jgi:serine/threonine protein kinase
MWLLQSRLVDREESLLHIWEHIEDGTRVANWEHSCSSQHILQLHIHYELPSGPSIPSYGPKDDDGDNGGDPNFGGSGDGSHGHDGENDSSDRNFDGSFGDSSGGSDSRNGGKDDESSSDSNQSYSYSTTVPHSTSTVEPMEDILPATVLESSSGFLVGKYASKTSNTTACRGLIAPKLLQYTYKRKRSFISLSAFRGDVIALEAITFSNLVQFMDPFTLYDIYSVFTMLHFDGNLASYLRRPDFLSEMKSPASLELLTPRQLLWSSVNSLAAAVSFLHSHNIIHGDLRPETVMIKGHNIFLSGFGVPTEFMNGVGVVRSTPLDAECSASELAQRAHQNQPADVWVLGCILFQIVTRCTGQTLDDLDNFRVSNGSWKLSSQHIREFMSLKNCHFKDDQMSNYEATMHFDAIRHMLEENPDARPTAHKAFVLLSNRRSLFPDCYVHKKSLDIGICTVEAAQDAITSRSIHEAPAASEDSPRCMSDQENNDHVEFVAFSNSHKPHNMGGRPSALASTENGPSITHFSIQPPTWTWENAFE